MIRRCYDCGVRITGRAMRCRSCSATARTQAEHPDPTPEEIRERAAQIRAERYAGLLAAEGEFDD